MRAVLVAAIELGVNDHEIGKIVDFGLRHPAIFGVNFQPAFRAQRHLAMDPMNRMTIPDVLKALELQTAGRFRMDDFVPVPCCMPTCNFVTYALLSGDEVTPITRLVDVEGHLDYLKNRTLGRRSRRPDRRRGRASNPCWTEFQLSGMSRGPPALQPSVD